MTTYSRFVVTVFATSAIWISGCGNPNDALMEEAVAAMEEYAACVESRKSGKELKQLKDRLDQLKAQVDALPPEERDRLLEKFERRGEQIADRMQKAASARLYEEELLR